MPQHGGTDLLANIVKLFKPEKRTGAMMVMFDAVVIGLNTLFFGEIEIALYSVAAIFIVGKILDIFFEGFDNSKMVYIISSKYEQIAKQIGKEMRRGVTSFYGKGMYKGDEKEILLCVVARNELGEIRKIVKTIDRKRLHGNIKRKRSPPEKGLRRYSRGIIKFQKSIYKCCKIEYNAINVERENYIKACVEH